MSVATRERPITFREREVRELAQRGEVLLVRPVGFKDFAPAGTKFAHWPKGFEWEFYRPKGREWVGCTTADLITEFCPVGQPGQRRWVREPWAQGVRSPVYRADFDVSDGFGSCIVELATGETVPLRWRASTQMPRDASRFAVEVASVEVERLTGLNVERYAAALDDDPKIAEAWHRREFAWFVLLRRVEG